MRMGGPGEGVAFLAPDADLLDGQAERGGRGRARAAGRESKAGDNPRGGGLVLRGVTFLISGSD